MLLELLQRFVANHRPPDFLIGNPDAPTVRRWWVIPRNRWFNIYLHNILRDDDDRALHDHPWLNCSIVLEGGYLEFSLDGRPTFRPPGSIIFRMPTTAHRLVLLREYAVANIATRPAWTLFITGPRIREWGFYCPQGWKLWSDFVKKGSTGEVGPGCGD